MWAAGHRDQLERKEAVEKNECRVKLLSTTVKKQQ